jgi:Predicted membrane protein
VSNEAIALPARTNGSTDVTSEPGPESRSSRVRAWLGEATWFWPVMATAGLVLWPLGGPVLWQDELVTLDVARRSLDQIFGLVQQVDVVHAAYYLVMHFWVMVWGESAFALRLPSALAMAGAAACVALVGRRLYGPRIGLVSGLVFALVPAVTRFGQEARPYAFVVLAAALSTLLLLRAVERPTVLRWAAYAVSVAACLVLNAVAGTIVAGHGVALLVLRSRRGAARPVAGLVAPVVGFVAAVVVAAAVAFPVLRLAMAQAERQITWVPRIPTVETWQGTVASVEVGYAMLALAVAAWVRPRRGHAVITAVVAVPMLAVWAYSQFQTINYFYPRYLLFTLPAVAVLVGAGLAAFRWRWAPVAGLLTIALLGLPDHVAVRSHLSHGWYTYPQARPPLTDLDYPAAARIIAEGYRPGDGVVYQRDGFWWRMIDVGVEHYLPDSVQLRDVFLQTTAADSYELMARECAAECLGAEPRLWVVVAGHTDDVTTEFAPVRTEALRSAYVQTWLAHPSGLTVGLLERRS